MAARQPDWDQLLLRSEDLVQQEVDLPRLERDILQIEQFSQRLRSKSARGDATAEAMDASRLLAQEGINPRKLTQALQIIELRPTYEDVFRVETSSVGEYIQQVHQMIAATAVQEAQRSAVAAFESHMDARMDVEWGREKRALLDSVAPFSAAVAPLASPGRAPSPYASAYRGTPGGAALSPLPGSGLRLRGRAARYADVVREINAAEARGDAAYESVVDFAAACADDGGGERRTTVLRLWQVAQCQLQGSRALPLSAKAQRQALALAGARGYLEQNFVAYMQTVVQTHRTQAALGGSPTRLALVQAYLRVREKDRAPLDFDQPGGVDTTWQRLFTCLRAGFAAEAIQVARGGGGGATPRAGPQELSAMLQEWVDGGCRPLPGEAGAAAAAECERLLRDKSARARQPFLAQRIMVHALVSGANYAADAVAREFPAFFPTIEDFLWLKLGLVRPAGAGPSSAASAAAATYTLADLQQYLQQYPPAHYSHAGREPLLYAVVLLLSCQFAAAVAFLARDASARDYRLDAVHLGICLWHSRAVEGKRPAGAGANGDDSGVGPLVHQYARSFARTDPRLALEYYMLAAAAMGGSLPVRGALLRELLTESRAYGLLLGAGGSSGEGGALAAFVPERAERGRVLEAVAAECAAAAQQEEAVELFMFAGRPRQALRILNHRFSDALEEEAAAGPGEEADTLASRGNAAVAALGASRDEADLQEAEAFEQLKAARALLAAAARGDHARVLRALGDLPFIPTDRFRLQLCAAQAASVHPAVAERLQALLLAAAEALAAGGRRDELQTVVAFAAAVPNRVSQAAYQRLNQLQAGAA